MTKHVIKTPYGTVETNYNEYEDICTSFKFYHPHDQTSPLTITEIGEIIEAIYSYYDYTYGDFWCIPKNFHLEIPLFQAKLMQQKYDRKN